jgi:hypothetical protein
MSAGTIIVIIIAALVVVAIIAGVAYDMRRRALRRRFGPEYDRLVEETGSRVKAEAELTGRQRRVAGLDIRPLDAAAQARYAAEWATVQERFVDAPAEAVVAAQRLVMTVMNERGYPTEGTDQVAADLSVEHANVLGHYRAAYDVSQRAGDAAASTEELRQAMIHYRALFQDLLGSAPQTVPAAAASPAGAATATPAGPASEAPASDVPVSDALASDAPASDAPTSEAPATEITPGLPAEDEPAAESTGRHGRA